MVWPQKFPPGVQLSSVSTNFTQGAAQLTGRATDLSIQGDGFFIVQRDGQQLFTRAGSLSFDALGRVVTPDGGILQGWPANADGTINTNASVGNLSMPLGQNIAPQGTTSVRLTIGTDGRVSGCEVTGSSGSSALDSATCNILRRRARFSPAMDSNGSPTSDTYSQRITWRVPAE